MTGRHGATHGSERTWRRRMVIAAATVAVAAATTLGAGSALAVPVPPVPPVGGPAPAQAGVLREIPVAPVAIEPESVVYDEKAKAFYASSQNTGAITKGYLDGRPSELFLPPLQFPRIASVGLALDEKGRLYIAGGAGGRVLVYDTRTKALLGDFFTGLGGFLNDVALDERGNAYVTDSLRPRIFRITAAQIAAGAGTPEAIATDPETSSLPVGAGGNVQPFNNNGIRVTPDGKYVIFGDLNDRTLYRMTPPPIGKPAERVITKIAVSGGGLGDVDGLEFVNDSLYVADNRGERILCLKPSADFSSAVIERAVTSPAFHTPTGIAKAPGERLLIANSELFDPNGPPFFVDLINRF